MGKYDYQIINEISSDIISVYESNEAYFMMAEGRKATLLDIEYDQKALPSSQNPIQKYFVSIQKDSDVIGVADFLVGYPHSYSLYIGLFMLHQKWQHKGIGKVLVQDIQDQMHLKGLSEMRLAVLKENQNALQFWKSLHFQTQDEVVIKNTEGNDVEVIRMYWKGESK